MRIFISLVRVLIMACVLGGSLGVVVPTAASRLEVIQNAQSSNVAEVGRWAFGPAIAVSYDASRNVVFLGSGGGLFVLDVTVPTMPVKLAELPTPGLVKSLECSGSFLYVAQGISGLAIYDVSDLSSPQLVSSFAFSTDANSVRIEGDYAYVAAASAGLRILDISDPAFPQEVSSYTLAANAYDVDVANGRAYVTDQDYKAMDIYDVSNPLVPQLLGTYMAPDFVFGVRVSGNYAYIAANLAGLLVVNVANPASPVLVGSFSSPVVPPMAPALTANDVFILGNRAFLADYNSGLYLLDVVVPSAPVELGYFNSFSHGYAVPGLAVAGSNHYAYLATREGGLKIADLSNPAQITEVGSFAVIGSSLNTAGYNGYAYVGQTIGSLQILDMQDVTQPSYVGAFGEYQRITRVAVYANRGYVIDEGRLRIYDLSNGAAPSLLGQFQTTGWQPWWVTVYGKYAYILDAYSSSPGLTIVDVSVPSMPVQKGFLNLAGSAWRMVIQGNYAYIANFMQGLVIVNISDPDFPHIVGNFNTDCYSYGVAVVGSLAYVADASCGLQIIDISNPASPYRAGQISLGSFAYDVAALGNLAYVAAGAGGLKVVDVSTPATPTIAGYYDTPGSGYSVRLDGNCIYLSDLEGGVSVLQYSTNLCASPARFFGDVPETYWSHIWIKRLYHANITGGCSASPMLYCPEAPVTRGQMAVFLERGMRGAAYTPPEASGSVFGDVPAGYWAAAWVEQFAHDGITSGCGGGNFCPDAPVTRAQMAVFLLRAKYGFDYTPPDVGSGTGFVDVPSDYWSAAWIKQLVVEGITSGCGGGAYCPSAPVTRAQMAVFLVRAFDLP